MSAVITMIIITAIQVSDANGCKKREKLKDFLVLVDKKKVLTYPTLPRENWITSLLAADIVKGPIPKSARPSAMSPTIPFQPIFLPSDRPPHFPSSGLARLKVKFKVLLKTMKNSPKTPEI